MVLAVNADASNMCNMYGQDDVLCQSQRLGDDITGRMTLDDKCYKGDDSACRELAKRRIKIKKDDDRKGSSRDIYKLRMKCYEYDNEEACNTLEELKR